MVSVPTLWVAFGVNFLALALVWLYILRSYPNFKAAGFWAAAAVLALSGSVIGMLRGVLDPVLVVITCGPMLAAGYCCACMGVERFSGLPVSWRSAIALVVFSFCGLGYFKAVQDDMAVRIVIDATAQTIPMLMLMRVVMTRPRVRRQSGIRLVGVIACLTILVHIARSTFALTGTGGALTMVNFNAAQAVMIMLLVFLSMFCNFGFLLMAIDRLRSEVADLALLDDLTGVANRRHLQQRLVAECAVARQTSEVFAILVIDLDGFKLINDRHGHAAGDECLRLFTRAAQSRLRPADMLARVGGDEFCVVLPATTQREGAMIARHILDTCRAQALPYAGAAIGVSIGVAQWHEGIGGDVDRLIAAADQALYAAKSQGKNRFAIFDHAPRGLEPALRRSA